MAPTRTSHSPGSKATAVLAMPVADAMAARAAIFNPYFISTFPCLLKNRDIYITETASRTCRGGLPAPGFVIELRIGSFARQARKVQENHRGAAPITPVQARRDWKIVAAESFRKLDELLEFCAVDPALVAADPDTAFPLRVTRHYASLIESGNHRDPLLLQVLPVAQERLLVDGYSTDPVGDRRSIPVPGLIHKYRGRALLALTGACAVHCRYCFRRHFPHGEAGAGLEASGPVMRYLADNTDIGEVILSGGDPLMLSDEKLSRLVGSLNGVPHLRTLRVHSRVPSVLPERVTESLLEVLGRFAGRVVIVTHINHPNEVSAANGAAFRLLHRRGYTLFNQSVLLRDVNDDVGTLAELSRKLFDNRIQPYYLHRLDKVQGAAHFDLAATESARIYRELRKLLPGYLVPTMVDEVPGEAAKRPVTCE
jgi:EF-P beta-lysylation protein EpmB